LWRDSPRAARDHERATLPAAPRFASLGGERAELLHAAGYRAVKPRLGDTLNPDMERAGALRSALGPDVALLADANCQYSVDDVRAMRLALTVAPASTAPAAATAPMAAPQPTDPYPP
jgi:L-alanine-DL-glutamate epimerase-like enolase superfamily enzyme